MLRVLAIVLPILTSCMGAPPADTGGADPTGAGPDGAPPGTSPLPPSDGRYRGACDGSTGTALDATRFLGFSDEDQTARVYERGSTGPALATAAVSAAPGADAGAEADLEDAARVGDRVYVIGSHGRKKDGTLDRARYRFAAFDVAGTALTGAGSYGRLLDDMLDPATWATPAAEVIAALAAASRLDKAKDADLAPKLAGTNIEGLAALPDAPDGPDGLAIGLRNPHPQGMALVVTLRNPAEVVAGSRARFGAAYRLDLGGLGIRGLAWSEALAAVLVLAGPSDESDGPFRLYRWTPGAAPVALTDVTPDKLGHPEAIVTYPNTKDVEILLDAGTDACKAADPADREFRDIIVHLD